MASYNKTDISTIFRFRWRVGQTTLRPWINPTSYSLYDNSSTGRYYDARNGNADDLAASYGLRDEVQNTAAKRFQNKLGEHSSFGATLTAELNETIGTVGGLVLRAAKAARAITKFNFAEAARLLGVPYSERTVRSVKSRVVRHRTGKYLYTRDFVTRKRVFKLPTGREVEKTLANGWLLWSYGVKPLASDIYNALEVFERPLEFEQRIVASATGSKAHYGSKTITTPFNAFDSLSLNVKTTVRFTGYVSVSNPNFRLLSQMGLTNPTQWVLEAIPFSFIGDWFSNLSDVIGNFSAYEGLSFRGLCVSRRSNGAQTKVVANPYENYSDTLTSFAYLRWPTSPPTVTFAIAYERFSPQRALNAVSLLIGFLPRR